MAYSPVSQVKTIDYSNDVFSSMTYDPAQVYRMMHKLTEDDTHTTQKFMGLIDQAYSPHSFHGDRERL